MQDQNKIETVDLKSRFISAFHDHPVLVTVAIMVVGAILLGDIFH